jgi:alkylated DNA repair protein (DNA oxidative demethylase)
MNGHITGVRYLPDYLDARVQADLVSILRAAAKHAPLFQPAMPRTGKPFSVRMTNLGELGWVSDRQGYRYQQYHPVTGNPWPAMPEVLLDLWREVSGYPLPPQACLVNFYDSAARMGLHQDKDEEDFEAPVVSVSLGDTAVFRIGGLERKSPTTSLKLTSGDVIVMGGEARLCFHGIDRILPGTSTLLREGGRINLTLRRVTRS